eukprot:4398944-Amphidinium_carterae.1
MALNYKENEDRQFSKTALCTNETKAKMYPNAFNLLKGRPKSSTMNQKNKTTQLQTQPLNFGTLQEENRNGKERKKEFVNRAVHSL